MLQVYLKKLYQFCTLECNLPDAVVVISRTMHAGTTDSEIIASVLRGEHQHYAVLVDRYQNLVFTIALRYAPAREDAEEIAQDVFVKAFQALAHFRGESKFSTWLYTIINSTSLTFLRKKRLKLHSLENDQTFEMANVQPSAMHANVVEQKSNVAMVNAAIKLLSPDDEKLIILFYKGEQSLEEISQILGVERNTVKVKLHRARQRLKEKMERYFSQEVKDIALLKRIT